MHFSSLKSVVAGGCLLLLSGCALWKDYDLPKPEVSAQWDQSEKSTPAEEIKTPKNQDTQDIAWWQQFQDPVLAKLIDQSLERNNDLKIAAARIEEAEAGELATFSDFFPRPEITGSGKRGTIGGTYKNHIDQSWQAGVGGTWNLDFFGGNRRRDQAAEAAIEASKAEEAQTRLKLIEEVARTYIRLRGLQQQMALTQHNIELQGQTLIITKAQFKERVVSKLDVLRANAQMTRTQSRLPQIEHEINIALNRLAVLLDYKVSNLRVSMPPPQKLPTLSAAILRTTPMETMQARPDIKIAQQRLSQSAALTGAALSDFFPKISLDGFFGRSDSKQFGFQSPWNAAVNGALPILNWGRLMAQYDTADAKQKQALYGFKQTVLAAMEDVQVAYSAYQNEGVRQQTLSKVAGEQAQAVEVARVQYKNGIVPQLDLLDAEQNLLDAQTGVVQSQEAVLENAIGLYTALAISEKKETETDAKTKQEKESSELTGEVAPASAKPDANPASSAISSSSAEDKAAISSANRLGIRR